ncbi:MAG: glycosyltransferase family 2 protein [Fusobacteriaceae bacterium]
MENSSSNCILKNEISAVVVWYNPTLEEVKNIKSYLEFINCLYIFDNTPNKKNDYLLKGLKLDINKIKYVSLGENKGIAFALNYIANLSYLKKYKWLLTMDQDSHFSNDTFKNYLLETKDMNLSEVGIISPTYHYHNKELKIKNEIEELEVVITSGNLVNLNIWKRLNGFDEKLFIDEVDHEYCYRLKRNRIKIYRYGKVILNHVLGKSCEKNILGKKISYTEHNAIRKFYIFRNSLYIMKLYPEYRNQYIKKLFKEVIKILFLEKDKIDKIKSIFSGVKSYQKNLK